MPRCCAACAGVFERSISFGAISNAVVRQNRSSAGKLGKPEQVAAGTLRAMADSPCNHVHSGRHGARQAVDLVDRKHGERRGSGRKIPMQDFESLPAQAALALNLTRADCVEIICGKVENLPQAFSTLDCEDRAHSLRARTQKAEPGDMEIASMPSVGRKLIRTEGLEKCILAAII